MRFEDVVHQVIRLAIAVNEESERLEKEHPDEGLFRRSEYPRPARDLLLNYLNQLDDEDVFKIEALMYYGRGDEELQDLHEYLTDEQQGFDRDGAVQQMMEKVPLPEYLETGLRDAQEAGIDLETPRFHAGSPMRRRSPS